MTSPHQYKASIACRSQEMYVIKRIFFSIYKQFPSFCCIIECSFGVSWHSHGVILRHLSNDRSETHLKNLAALGSCWWYSNCPSNIFHWIFVQIFTSNNPLSSHLRNVTLLVGNLVIFRHTFMDCEIDWVPIFFLTDSLKPLMP